MDESGVRHRQNSRNSKKDCSFIVSSSIGVIIYLLNVLLTILFLSWFSYVYVRVNKKSDICFLQNLTRIDSEFDDDDGDTPFLCESSIGGIALFLLLQIILVYLGLASIASGRRCSCFKNSEICLVLFFVFVTTVFAFIASYVIHDGNAEEVLCELIGSACKTESDLFFLDVICWVAVILYFFAFIVLFTDCICHLPSRRNVEGRHGYSYSDEQWHDQQYLLKDSEAKRIYS